MPYISGKRVRLRAAEKEDIPNFLRWINDEKVSENLPFRMPISRFEEEDWYESMMKRPTSEHVLVIEIKDHKNKGCYVPIGNCTLIHINWRNRSTEIGIMIGEKSFWDQGYGTETMQLVLEHAFNNLNLHRIWLRVFPENKRGIRVYEKAGFKYEGMYRQAEYKNGAYHDVHLMSILLDEWKKLQTNP